MNLSFFASSSKQRQWLYFLVSHLSSFKRVQHAVLCKFSRETCTNESNKLIKLNEIYFVHYLFTFCLCVNFFLHAHPSIMHSFMEHENDALPYDNWQHNCIMNNLLTDCIMNGCILTTTEKFIIKVDHHKTTILCHKL